MSAEDCRRNGCSGCPLCSDEMAAILRDATAGRFEALAHKMANLTARTMRLLRVTARHPAAKFVTAGGSGTVEGPSHAGYVAKFKRGATTAADRLREAFDDAFSGRSEISPAPRPSISPGAHQGTVAPPNMNEMIKEKRSK
jgi:hypothetical protein